MATMEMDFFTFQQVVPHPLRGNSFPAQSVWNATFSLKAEEKYLVYAPSGTGKTTFVSLLYGMRRDYEGLVKMENQDIRSFSLKDWGKIRREKISMIFQDMLLFPQLTLRENFQLKMDLCAHKDMKWAEMAATRLGIAQKMDTRLGLMSLGQQQRAAIIRALLQPFRFLLMDEPFSHIDESNTVLAVDLIQEVLKENGAGLISTGLGDNSLFTYHQKLIIA